MIWISTAMIAGIPALTYLLGKTPTTLKEVRPCVAVKWEKPCFYTAPHEPSVRYIRTPEGGYIQWTGFLPAPSDKRGDRP